MEEIKKEMFGFTLNRRMRRRGILPDGSLLNRKPFNNRANTSKRKGVHSRVMNELKKKVYGEYKKYRRD